MADERIVTNIVANADFSNLIADVHKVTASLSKLQEQIANSNKMLANQVAVMNRTFSETLRSTGQFSTHFVSLASDVEKFGKNLDGGKLKLKQYYDAFQNHAKTSGGLIRDLAKQQVALQNAILQPLGRNAQGLMQFNVQVPRGLDETRNKAALARQELQIMNKVIQEGANQLINWGKNTQWAGRQLTVGLTIPMAAFGKAAADAFRNADEQLVRLTKVYGGLQATSAQELLAVRKNVAATARELASGYGASFKETLGLAADIAATGKTGNELLGSIKETTRLAVLGEVDRQDAMKATLALQSAFKQNTEQLSESINFLNAVENQTSTTLGDLIEAIPKAGPVIEGLGGSVKDLALYLTAMKEGGVNASEGANALKSALASLINPTKTATDMFAGFGIDLKGIVTSNAGNLTDTLLALQGALDKLNPLQKQQALEQLFGKFQFARMNALFENLGRQGSQTLQVLDLMKASSQDLANIAGRELSQVTESASGKYRRAIEGLKADLAGVGEQFLNINTTLINIIDKVLKFADKLPKPIKQVLSLIGGLTAIAGPFIMLTGVLANFFGYIVKGISHMRSFFRGGEGWKYLTPEMLAAEKAGSMVEKTFYSDAKAASILQIALKNLIDEFTVLEQKAKSGAISVAPTIQTMAGNIVTPGVGPRVVDPRHPLVGQPYSRASTHMVPRSGMTEEQRMAQTMFGFVPGSIPVNRKIGNNPQIYMNEGLPNVPGLTSIGGVSTGVVASEAAKWHAMQAALGMQSKQEIAALKKEIATTGLLSKDFMSTFETILPAVTTITDNAAKESAAIVAEFRAGTVTLEQARAKIIALNLQVEQMLATTTGELATGMGRSFNPTVVPTLDQPVVDPSGKSNMRELFKKGRTRSFINRVAGALGVRTSGAGYNIETTIPKKFALGNIVPGTGNSDTVPAMLTPGEFVVNKDATAKNLPLLMAINGQGSNGPGYNIGSNGAVRSTEYENVLEPRMTGVTSEEMRGAFGDRFRGNRSSYRLRGTAGVYLNTVTDPAIVNRYSYLSTDGKTISVEAMNARMATGGLPYQVYEAAMGASKHQYSGSSDQLLHTLARNGIITSEEAASISADIDREFRRDLRRQVGVRDAKNKYWAISNRIIQNRLSANSKALGFWNAFSREPAYIVSESLRSSGEPMRSPSMELRSLTHNGETIKIDPLKGKRGQSFFAHARTPVPLLRRLMEAGITTMGRRALPFRWSRSIPMRNRGGIIGMNSGGIVPRYGMGGLVGSILGGTAISLGGSMLGSAVGGGLGSAISMGSGILGSLVGFGGVGRSPTGQRGFIGTKMEQLGQKSIMGQSLTQPIGPLKSVSSALEGFAGKAGMAGRMLGPVAKGLSSILRITSPLGLGLTAITLAVGFGIKKWKEHQEELRLNRLGYGMTAEAAKAAGLKYTDYNAKVKEAIDNAKALRERNKMVYESMTQSGTPLKMTIEQYKQLKEQVKSTMGDYIKLFDQTKRTDVGDVAIRLKAQFMAAGDSAEKATAKVYALIAQSNKASMAGSTIGSKGFQAIQTPQDAALQTTKTFEAAMNVADAKTQADALLTSFQAIDTAVASTVSESERLAKQGKISQGEIKTAGQATKEELDKLNTSYTKQTTLSKEVISEIAKQDPELANVLNTTDTLTSAWAKYQLIIQGVNIDVKNLSAAGAQAALQLAQIISTQTSSNPIIAAQTKKYKDLQNQIDGVTKAARGQSVQQQINSRDAIAALQKRIDLIRKEAQNKIDGIRKATEAENAQLDIKKEQLAASEALAKGDMTAYAQAQLNIEQLTNTANQKAAEQAITDKANLDIEPLQKQIDALNDKNKKLADKASLAGESLQSLNKKAGDLNSNLTSYTQNINNLLFKLQTEGDKFKLTDEYKNAIAAIADAGKKLGITSKPEDILAAIQKTLSQGVTAQQVNIYTGQLNSNAGRTAFTKENPFSASSITGLDVEKNKNGVYVLNDESKRKVVSSGNLQTKDIFTWGGRYYRVKEATYTTNPNTGEKVLNRADVIAGDYIQTPTKALGGMVFRRAQNGVQGMLGSQPYLVGERGPELFVPSASGQIIPNNMLNVKYNIPSGNLMASGVQSSASSNNSVYNIDIALNGTNVTADDVVRKFKQELALINAKEGRDRYFGGNV